MTAAMFASGSLVRLRGREWVVVENEDDGSMLVRPLGGIEAEAQRIIPKLEREVSLAAFDPPSFDRTGSTNEARLLRDALRMSLRRGAGPFRSFGRLGFEPRAYQLVPLLMAMKQEPVRLLIADDVGIGKTIEAGLICRELLDRGEINSLSVICPPHLVDQWVVELRTKFFVDAVPVTAATAQRLERGMRPGVSLFEEHPFTVVSLDYIKQTRRADEFARVCPRFVIVDEAHACVGGGEGRQHQRFRLLRTLADDVDRNLVLLTATPHSGDVAAFSRLAGLLDREFHELGQTDREQHRSLRERFGEHFVQRRRVDIDAWKEPGLFPRPHTREHTYRLHPAAEAFYQDVLDYCAEVTERAGADIRSRRLAFWGTLALMRCVASSPVAAWQALKTRAKSESVSEEEEALLATRAFDGDDDDLTSDDVEPGVIDDPALAALVAQAEALARDPSKDEKIKALIRELKGLTDQGFSPVVFCRFIGTAKSVSTAIEAKFKDHTVDCVTGELPADERKERILELGEADKRILVATDCLSEGINLQAYFDAVVHYDLSWNPTRHQQREGRVNRFGQPSPEVRSVLLYGENNPVDGAVLQVILKKAEQIRKATGVPVPLPDDQRAMTEALMKAVLLRRKKGPVQLELFDQMQEAKEIERQWQDASEREKRSQTIYAQRALKPEQVIPEWEKARAALGGGADAVKAFLANALQRVGAPLATSGDKARFVLPDDPAYRSLKEQLESAAVRDDTKISFNPNASGEFVHRAHPLVSVVAEFLFERALDPEAGPAGDAATLARAGAWTSASVTAPTTVALLRLRHRLEGPNQAPILCEEAAALAWSGDTQSPIATGDDAFALLDVNDAESLAEHARARVLARARDRLDTFRAAIELHAEMRAEILRDDHDRVRVAALREKRSKRGAITVVPCLPVDVIGLYVLQPAVH